MDAKRIAVYASRFQDKVQYYERPSEDIERLKQLESERSLYVTDLAKYKGQLKDQREYIVRTKGEAFDGFDGELGASHTSHYERNG